MVMIIAMLFGVLIPMAYFSNIPRTTAVADRNAVATAGDADYDEEIVYQFKSLEVYPDEGDLNKSVTLDGLMPCSAEANAVDVTDDYVETGRLKTAALDGSMPENGVIAAYDITINESNLADSAEFQPIENYPITVTINDPRISVSENLELWHVKDDGTREKVEDVEVHEGKVCFKADGFSVYEIVGDAIGEASSFFDFLDEQGADGFYTSISFTANESRGPYHFTGTSYNVSGQNGRTGVRLTAIGSQIPNNAVKMYFEKNENAENEYYIYFVDVNGDEEQRKYLISIPGSSTNNFGDKDLKRAALGLTTDENEKTSFKLYNTAGTNKVKVSAGEYYWVADNKNGMVDSVVGYQNGSDPNIAFLTIPIVSNDLLGLNGKTYGLMHHSGNSATANALMAQGAPHSLIKLVIRSNHNDGKPFYVDQDNEISRWTFHEAGDDKYTLSAVTDDGKVYLRTDNGSLTTTADSLEATEYKVVPGTGAHAGKIQLVAGNSYVTYIPGASESDAGTFGMTASSTDENTWLDFADYGNMDDDDLITYSASRVSISEVQDKQKVIVYTRVWNEQDLKYDIYAVDYDGSLYPCYASGGKILWLGDGTGSLEWEFTEYVDEVTKKPNGYYELYNPYSEKYLVPQFTDDEVLSDHTIGINLPGRSNGEFYSNIISWDDPKYAYVSFKPNEDKTKLVPCSQAVALPFYFATLDELNIEGTLHEVRTVDNNTHGITMKMIDFGQSGKFGAADSDVTSNYFGGSATRKMGLLSTNLVDDYPVVIGSENTGQNDKSFSTLYSDAVFVNHLFTESVYNSSGYFEFDSCQTFATLCEYNADGTDFGLKPTYAYTDKDGNELQFRDFTVYKELGSIEANKKSSLQHGQFLPYDIIKGGVYTTKNNMENLYGALTDPNRTDVGKLPDTDPRKYEKLHKVQTKDGSGYANAYFGMEMEASFTQTVSGLDSWEHDIIFEFRGDDDFWLYVDNELVLDLGGVHSAIEGKINFRTGEVIYDNGTTSVHNEKTMIHTNLRAIFESNYRSRNPEASDTEVNEYLSQYFADGENIFKDYSEHTMRVFYMERGAGASNLYMRFNIASVTPGHVSVKKQITGAGADNIDQEFMEYPFQIYYYIPELNEDGTPKMENGEIVVTEYLLGQTDEHFGVSYQNSNQPVNFAEKYVPPGGDPDIEGQYYSNVYFLNPTKSAEIAFPDEAIEYRIVECAVDPAVYGEVKINGEAVEGTQFIGFLNYSSDIVSVVNRPIISFENVVNEDAIRTLKYTKVLYDENDEEMTYYSAYDVEQKRQEFKNEYPDESDEQIEERIDQFLYENKYDPGTFNFRLSVSPYEVAEDKIPRANLYKYYVIAPNGKMCIYDSVKDTFVPSELDYDTEAIKAIVALTSEDEEDDDIVEAYNAKPEHVKNIEDYNLFTDDIIFITSPNGAISKIPAGYSVYVPNLPAGTVFKVTEDDKTGYGLKEKRDGDTLVYKGYEQLFWQKVAESTALEPTYEMLVPTNAEKQNSGRVIVAHDPEMKVNNRKGYGLTVKKSWSDIRITTGHDPIYVAVYVDGELLDGSVRKIVSPSTSTYYFWPRLQNKLNGDPRISFEGYVVKEVTLIGDPDNFTVASDGTVSGYDEITPVENGGEIEIEATRTEDTTPPDEQAKREFKYIASYTPGENTGSSRTDNIMNTREGGLQIRLFKWDSDVPLEGGVFELRDHNGNLIKKYTSAPDGTVTILYDFERNSEYILTQISAPKGYVGLQDTFKFVVDGEGNSTLYNADGTAWSQKKWANGKKGENGIEAYIDVYNKPFIFKIMKKDNQNADLMLQGAHFSLYKQANTSISGYVKNKSPMTGFEDFSTNGEGEVVVTGEDSGRAMTPGEKGSVYFLTEISAPSGYAKLEDDIIFRLSPLGQPTLIQGVGGDEDIDQIVELEDCYVYTLSVPNEKTAVNLTVTKKVEGSLGDKSKEFTFTLTVADASEIDEYEWSKNGEEQAEKLKSGDTFTLRHKDSVTIALPPGVDITIAEDNPASQGYEAKFKLGDEAATTGNSKTFQLTDDTSLIVTNTRGSIVPSGVIMKVFPVVAVGLIVVIVLGVLIFRSKRRDDEDEDETDEE